MLLSLLYPPASRVTLDWSDSLVVRCARNIEEKLGMDRESLEGKASTLACLLMGLIPSALQTQEPETIAATHYRSPSSIPDSAQALVMGLNYGEPTVTIPKLGTASVPGGGVSATQIGLMFAATVIVLDQHYGTDFNSSLEHRIDSLKLYASTQWENFTAAFSRHNLDLRNLGAFSPLTADASPVQVANITQEQQEILDAIDRGTPLTLKQIDILKAAFDNHEDWLWEQKQKYIDYVVYDLAEHFASEEEDILEVVANGAPLTPRQFAYLGRAVDNDEDWALDLLGIWNRGITPQ